MPHVRHFTLRSTIHGGLIGPRWTSNEDALGYAGTLAGAPVEVVAVMFDGRIVRPSELPFDTLAY